MCTSCTFNITTHSPNWIVNITFKSRLILFYQLRRTGIQESTENSLSSKSRAPRSTPSLHLNETNNVEHDGKVIWFPSWNYYQILFLPLTFPSKKIPIFRACSRLKESRDKSTKYNMPT